MDIYDFEARTLEGAPARLDAWRGKVLLIVNTASKCGFTPQYEGLEALQRQYGERGFAVLAFPCNQFGDQEPGDAAAIRDFCSTVYDVTFPIFTKIDVNGPAADPLYTYLKAARPGLLGSRAVKWNFTKFLVDRQGRPVARFGPSTTPRALASAIEKRL